MSERRNTLVCCFEQNSPRMTAFDIHEWINEQLKVTEHSVLTIQIDGTRRQVYIKFKEFKSVQDILDATKGETIYKYVTGEITPVRLMIAGMGTRRIRLANLPPELTNNIPNAINYDVIRFQTHRTQNLPLKPPLLLLNAIIEIQANRVAVIQASKTCSSQLMCCMPENKSSFELPKQTVT